MGISICFGMGSYRFEVRKCRHRAQGLEELANELHVMHDSPNANIAFCILCTLHMWGPVILEQRYLEIQRREASHNQAVTLD